MIEALNEISLQTGVIILTDQYVTGLVTAEFYDVELETVLDLLLLPGGYSYKRLMKVCILLASLIQKVIIFEFSRG